MAATDILQAVGAIIGGLGGCAGFYALHIQHQEQLRLREALPPELTDHVLTLMRAAHLVVEDGHQEPSHYEHPPNLVAHNELLRLTPLIRDDELRRDVRMLAAWWESAQMYAQQNRHEIELRRVQGLIDDAQKVLERLRR